tara:strand:+ start:86 stop:634 length:549 start_codon:yes stop_codon:yes gene_type:complete
MEWLNKVAKHHKEYIKYVHKMGNTSHAEDLVQECYLRLVQYDCGHKVIREDGTVNKTYVWRVLSNLFKSYKNSSSKFNFIQVEECTGIETEQPKNEQEEAYERIMQKLFKELSKLDRDNKYNYNEELFTLYASSAMSMRCISSITKISLTSIFNTINNCREQLSDELREDIEDFNNGDYELI